MHKKIVALVVDDDKDSLSLISTYLKTKNLAVKAFSCPKEALNYINDPLAKPIDIIFTDFNMPHMTGIDLMKRLIEQGKNIPTVMVSADGADANVREQAFKNGAICIICKPFRLQVLEDVLDSVIREKTKPQSKNKKEDTP